MSGLEYLLQTLGCLLGVMPKWVMSDVYSMGCALRKEAHEVQMGINMHSVIK